MRDRSPRHLDDRRALRSLSHRPRGECHHAYGGRKRLSRTVAADPQTEQGLASARLGAFAVRDRELPNRGTPRALGSYPADLAYPRSQPRTDTRTVSHFGGVKLSVAFPAENCSCCNASRNLGQTELRRPAPNRQVTAVAPSRRWPRGVGGRFKSATDHWRP